MAEPFLKNPQTGELVLDPNGQPIPMTRWGDADDTEYLTVQAASPEQRLKWFSRPGVPAPHSMLDELALQKYVPGQDMNPQSEPFGICLRQWYAWQMMPGYVGVPYFSPIYVTDVKSGDGILELEFFNVFYSEGVQNFHVKMKVLKRAATYLVGDLIYGEEDSGRCGIVSQIGFKWIEQFCPDLWSQYPRHSNDGEAPQNVSTYLDQVFFPDHT